MGFQEAWVNGASVVASIAHNFDQFAKTVKVGPFAFDTVEVSGGKVILQTDSVVSKSTTRLRPRARSHAKPTSDVNSQSNEGSSRMIGMSYMEAFRATPMDRIRLIKQGISARVLEQMAKEMSISKERLAGMLGLARVTVGRKVREDKPLSADEGSRVLGMASLIGQVQMIIEESGNPDGFNAAEWVARWIDRPLPALGGQKPAELMDTFDGQMLVSGIVSRMQSGAYL